MARQREGKGVCGHGKATWLASGRLVQWTGNTTSPSEPTAGHAQGLESLAAPPQGQARTGMSQQSEPAEVVQATREQPDTGPSPGPSDPEGSGRKSLFKVVVK